MRHGFYSLIQFVPDSERAEGANVGVLVFCPEVKPGIVAAHSARPPHLRDLCKQPPTERELAQLISSLEQRLRNDSPSDLPAFIKALGREAGKLRAISPRAVPMVDLPTTAQELCSRLVGEAPHRERSPRQIPAIEALRDEPGMADLIQRGGEVPVAGKIIKPSYVWQNGKPNVVVNTRLRDDQSATEAAYQWGAKGHMLLEKPVDATPRQLAVVTTIEKQVTPKARDEIGAIFKEFAVDWVRPDTLDAYVGRIRREVHA